MVENIVVGDGRLLDETNVPATNTESPGSGRWALRSAALVAPAALAACGGGGGDGATFAATEPLLQAATPPPAGTTPPPAGTTSPPAGTTSPPAGTTSPPAGTTSPPTGTTSPPAGTTSPPAGTTSPPAGTTSPPAGTTSPPTGTTSPPTGTTPAQRYLYREANSDAEAARFLLQAQGWASDAQLAAVRSLGYSPWLGAQMDAAPTQTAWVWVNSKPYDTVKFDALGWRQLIAAPDSMRQRMALALSEIFVVSGTDFRTNWTSLMMAQYWDTLVAGVTGNFRTLLEAITLNPAMGYFLNTKGNQKEDGKGRQPDENFGREIMQLMSIGLVMLNADGSVQRGADGVALETYTQEDVTNIARVFTGYDLDITAADKDGFTTPGAGSAIETNAWTTRPMALTASRHSTLEARFLDAVVPGGTEGKAALKIALDTLYNHPNVGPFIGKQLIQRLVTSNPSPGYVARVSAVFADNGAGVRGDMKSVFAAVLLDDEARSPDGLSAPTFGRLREPMLRLVQWARTFGATSPQDTWNIGNATDSAGKLSQSPLRSPSVFNFFRPGYVPPSTAIATSGMVAPEFQLVNETSVGGYLNYIQSVIEKGPKDVSVTYTTEKAIALDASALVDRLNLLLCANQLSAATVSLIKATVGGMPITTDANKNNRVFAAIFLVMGCPEYLIQK